MASFALRGFLCTNEDSRGRSVVMAVVVEYGSNVYIVRVACWVGPVFVLRYDVQCASKSNQVALVIRVHLLLPVGGDDGVSSSSVPTLRSWDTQLSRSVGPDNVCEGRQQVR